MWTEIALWWPQRRVLVCGDALGTAPYYLAPNDRLGVHPFLRFLPPQRLGGLEPAHVLVGHGEGIHEQAERRARGSARDLEPPHPALARQSGLARGQAPSFLRRASVGAQYAFRAPGELPIGPA